MDAIRALVHIISRKSQLQEPFLVDVLLPGGSVNDNIGPNRQHVAVKIFLNSKRLYQ